MAAEDWRTAAHGCGDEGRCLQLPVGEPTTSKYLNGHSAHQAAPFPTPGSPTPLPSVPLAAAKLGLRYADGSLRGGNARCIAMLQMFIQCIQVGRGRMEAVQGRFTALTRQAWRQQMATEHNQQPWPLPAAACNTCATRSTPLPLPLPAGVPHACGARVCQGVLPRPEQHHQLPGEREAALKAGRAARAAA